MLLIREDQSKASITSPDTSIVQVFYSSEEWTKYSSDKVHTRFVITLLTVPNCRQSLLIPYSN